MRNFNQLFIYRKKIVKPYVDYVLTWGVALSYLMSIVMIVAVIFEHGFIISFDEKMLIHKIYALVCSTFLVNTSLHIAFDYSSSKVKYRGVTWIVSLMLYLTLIPVIFYEPNPSSWIHYIWSIFNSPLYKIGLLVTLSFLQLSNGIVLLLSKRVNPSFIFSISFFIIILLGTGLLMLPRSTYEGISFLDALFTSTSATCVTGLATVDISSVFTPIGIFIIMLLIQVGGLGVMTLTSFFALFFMGNASLNNQVMMCDMVSSKSLNSLISTLLYIFGFTLIIEASGAAIILYSIHGSLGMTFNEEVAFSIFHSVSAFCNAGFSTLPNNLGNEALMSGHNIFYWAISILIILGGIGFPILVNIYETVKYKIFELYERYIKQNDRVAKRVHLYNLNTRIVMLMTLILITSGTLIIAILEWNNGFATMPMLDKFTHSFFTAVCPRTAGFNSVTISSFSIPTILLIIMMMMIGGGTQSTAGGIKVNVFAVIILNLKAILYGTNKVTIFNRQLSDDSIRRSNSTLILYLMFMFVGLFTLSIMEPEADLVALLFECISALSTVGASLDLTASLGGDSKVVIIILMFVGRVGVLTMMSSLIKQHKNIKYKYPSGTIIIN